ncbi:MAG TPA: rhodanese-like domain-containing protein [Ramlibacter sp.]|uniref:rhodanese-like domain-containing protein n=1 Tax=Ramlibacter sp. TaxID=1917967 RepID=UPI002BD43D97|nr:rhodanese-like domain-containing protein [Ramlibacter sp.]HVZ46634.1 rhodanese-like domain-containing protein [Ramlibacter sp.]
MLVQVRPSELQDWLASLGPHAATALLLDVREPWEVQAASVAPSGFELATVPMNRVAAWVAQIDPERPVACLCHHGTRSLRVAMFLAQSGFERVANVAGGIDAWSQELDAGVPRY